MQKSKEIILSKSETENRVFEYIIKNTPKDASKFNPTKLETLEISKNTKLSIEDVEEALNNLSQDSARIEKINANFSYWLPLTEESDEIKREMYARSISHYSVFVPVFILIILTSLLFQRILIPYGVIDVGSFGSFDFFYWGAIFSGVYVVLVKNISKDLYTINEKLRKVKYLKIYSWSFIVFTSLITYMVMQGWHNSSITSGIVWGISIVANLITIIFFLISAFKEK